MKRCPKCNSSYTDDSLAFCLADGTRLIADSGSFEQPTLVQQGYAAPVTTQTRAGVSPVFKWIAAALAALVLLFAGAGFAIWMLWPNLTPDEDTANRNSPGVVTNATSSKANLTPDPTPQPPAARNTNTSNRSNSNAAISGTTDPGTARITFRRGSTGETVSGMIVRSRSFVLTTLDGQSLTALVSSNGDCVLFDGGSTETSFVTDRGDTILRLRNECGKNATFSLHVSVR